VTPTNKPNHARQAACTRAETDGPLGTLSSERASSREPDLCVRVQLVVTLRLLVAVTLVAFACVLSSCQSSGARMVDCAHGYHNTHGPGSHCVPDRP
jgi:hypothetical protein